MSRTLTVVALILVLAGCGESDSESSDTSETTATVEATQTTTETTQTIASNDPLACLEEAGLSNVEERERRPLARTPRRSGLRDRRAQAQETGKSPDRRRRDVRRDGIIQGRCRGHRATELGTRCRFSGARGCGLLRRLAPHPSPQRLDGVGAVFGLDALAVQPLVCPRRGLDPPARDDRPSCRVDH